jgi:ribosomal protein L7/L12
VYQDEDMTNPAPADTYTTATGSKVAVKGGQVEKVIPPDPDAAPDASDNDDETTTDKFKSAQKPMAIQNKLQQIKAKLHAQNALLREAKDALETANICLQKTREEVKNEIKSDFTPEGSKRSNKAKTEPVAFFAPTSTLAKNAVKKAIAN